MSNSVFENQKKFVSLYVDGKVGAWDILDHINNWHETSGELSLHDFLGFDFDEYMLFVDSDENLIPILECKKIAEKKKKARPRLKLIINRI